MMIKLCFIRLSVFPSRLVSNLSVCYVKKKSPSLHFLQRLHNDAKIEKLCDEEKRPSNLMDRYHELKKAQLTMLYNFVRDNTQLPSDEEWDNLLRNVSNSGDGISILGEKYIHSKTMEHCALFKKLDLAINFIFYLKKRGYKLNSGIVVEFINVCYNNENALTEEDYKNVRYFTNHLLSKFKVMDSKLGTAAVKGLALLGDWRKCDEVIKDLEKNIVLSNSAYSALVNCLLRSEKIELAREKLIEFLGNQRQMSDQVYHKWIEKSLNNSTRLQELLTLFQDYEVIPRKSTCDRLVDAFSQLPSKKRLKGEFTKIHRMGKCQSCKSELKPYALSSEEFDKLRKTFLDEVLISGDIFKNSTPDELKAFFKCVQLHAPFDIVVDGLNVMFRAGTQSSKTEQAKLLKDVVDYYFERNEKILIIGKKHMKTLPSNIMKSIQERSVVFLVDDSSEDDPFMIYATLFSGSSCFYVTKDLMRSEKFRLTDSNLQGLFKKWQLTHQVTFSPIKRLILKPPLQFKICAQKNGLRGWHIPYHENSYVGNDIYEEFGWLCLKKY